MGEKTDWLPCRLAEKLLETVSIILMLYAALYFARLFFEVSVNTVIVGVLCLIYAGISVMGTLSGQRRLSLAVLAGAMLLLCAVLGRYHLAAEAFAASFGYPFFALIHKFDWPRRIYVSAVVGCLAAAFIGNAELPKILISAVILLLLKELAALYGSRFSVQLMPFLAGVALAVFILPVSGKPFDWSFVVRIGGSAVMLCQNIIREAEYFLSDPEDNVGIRVGYGGDGSIGGALAGNEAEELYVVSKKVRGNLYLKGRQYTTLEDETWTIGETSDQPYGLWYAQFLNALESGGISGEEAQTFAEVRVLEITYGYLKTRDVIRPENLLYIDENVTEELTDDIGAFTYRSVKKRGHKLNVRYLDLDYANPYFTELLENLSQHNQKELLPYDRLLETSQNFFRIDLEQVITREAYEAYALKYKEARARSESDPMIADWQEELLAADGVTGRVRELAARITRDCESDYEKGKAIEGYLRNYTYSRNTDLRGSESFIDEFLFEQREGYCVHYASAMVMLLRLNGIPARLAEGYCCDYSDWISGDRYAVKGSSAHVWPEAYMEGFGWVRFEPTASISSAESMGWGKRVQKEETIQEVSESDQNLHSPDPVLPKNEPVDMEGENEALNADARESIWSWNTAVMLTCALGMILLFTFFLFFALYLLKKKVLWRRKGKEALLKANLADLCYLIRKIHPGEWENRFLMDYAAVMEEEGICSDVEAAFLLYYRLHYRNIGLTGEEWELLKKVHQKVYACYLDSAGGRRRRYRILAFLNCHLRFY